MGRRSKPFRFRNLWSVIIMITFRGGCRQDLSPMETFFPVWGIFTSTVTFIFTSYFLDPEGVIVYGEILKGGPQRAFVALSGLFDTDIGGNVTVCYSVLASGVTLHMTQTIVSWPVSTTSQCQHLCRCHSASLRIGVDQTKPVYIPVLVLVWLSQPRINM